MWVKLGSLKLEPTAILVPPRPNLGPEPFVEWPSALAIALRVGLALVALACVLGLFDRTRRLLRNRRRAAAGSPTSLPESPRERVIAWTELVRDALVARFGPSWRARTTDEIARAPELAAVLGPGPRSDLIDLLTAADRVKFDDPDAPDPEVRESYRELVAALRPLAPEAGARSRIKGR